MIKVKSFSFILKSILISKVIHQLPLFYLIYKLKNISNIVTPALIYLSSPFINFFNVLQRTYIFINVVYLNVQIVLQILLLNCTFIS